MKNPILDALPKVSVKKVQEAEPTSDVFTEEESSKSKDETLFPILVDAFIESYREGYLAFEPAIRGLALFIDDYEPIDLDSEEMHDMKLHFLHDAVNEITTIDPETFNKKNKYKPGMLPPTFKAHIPLMIERIKKRYPGLTSNSPDRGGSYELFEFAAERLRDIGFHRVTEGTVRNAFYGKKK